MTYSSDSCCKQMTDYRSMDLKNGHDRECDDSMKEASCNDGEGCRPTDKKVNSFKTRS